MGPRGKVPKDFCYFKIYQRCTWRFWGYSVFLAVSMICLDNWVNNDNGILANKISHQYPDHFTVKRQQ